jgi:hypothetical protein
VVPGLQQLIERLRRGDWGSAAAKLLGARRKRQQGEK